QQGSEDVDHLGEQDPRDGYGIPRGAGGAPQRAHHLSYRTLQDASEGPPLPAWPHDARGPAPSPAGLPQEQGHQAVPRPHRQAWYPQVAPGRDEATLSLPRAVRTPA